MNTRSNKVKVSNSKITSLDKLLTCTICDGRFHGCIYALKKDWLSSSTAVQILKNFCCSTCINEQQSISKVKELISDSNNYYKENIDLLIEEIGKSKTDFREKYHALLDEIDKRTSMVEELVSKNNKLITELDKRNEQCMVLVEVNKSYA